MDRRTILAVTLCFLIFMGWQKYYIEPRTQPRQQTTQTAEQTPQSTVTQGTQATPGSPAATATASAPAPTSKHPPETRTLATGTGTATLSDGAAIFKDWNLKSYKLGIAPEAAAVDMRSVTNQDGELQFAFDDPQLAYLAKDIQGNFSSLPQGNGVAWTYDDANVHMVREITASEGQPFADVRLTVDFKARKPAFAFVSLASQGMDKDPEAQDRQLVYFTNNSLERVHLKDVPDTKEVATPIKYIGATNRYFVMAVVNQSPVEPKLLLQPVMSALGPVPHAGRVNLAYPVMGNSITIPLRVYFGPKELELLRAVDPTLDHTVDLGMFTVFAYPLLKILKVLYNLVKNYGVAIILLTVLIKLITYPLTYKSMKSMKEMAKLQPQLAKVREKYKDDKEALNREMLTLMRTHGYNPMAGCVPILIQMPVFFALYRVLYSSIELYHAPFVAWINDLSAHDPYYVTPVVLAITMFLQQKLQPNTATDPAQQKMMQFMPLIFGFMMISLPSGLTLYMLVNALTSIVQQLWLNKKFNTTGTGRMQPA